MPWASAMAEQVTRPLASMRVRLEKYRTPIKVSASTPSQLPLMPRTSVRLPTARSTCSAAASRFWSPAATVCADCSNLSWTVAMSRRARATPWKIETSTTGNSARVMIACSRRRRVQPGSRGPFVMALLGAFFSGEEIGAPRAELIKLRHDLTSGFPPGGPRNIAQRVTSAQNLYQGLAGPGNPAFHRAHGAFADRGGVFIGETARAHQDQRFALFVGQMFERAHRVGQFGRMKLVLAPARDAFGGILIPGRLAPGAAAVGIELVAQDREQPGLQIGAGDKAGAALPSLDQGLLRQIVGGFLVAGQGAGEGAQERHKTQQFGLEVRIFRLVGMGGRGGGGHHETLPPPLSPASSIWRSRSMKSSGTGSCATSSYMRRNSRPMARWRARIARAFSLGFSSLATLASHCCVIFGQAISRFRAVPESRAKHLISTQQPHAVPFPRFQTYRFRDGSGNPWNFFGWRKFLP